MLLTNTIKSTTDIEQLIEIVGLIAGIVLAGIRGLTSLFASISSYKVEIGLMTKREQWKFVITNLAILAFSILLLNVLFCFWCQNEVAFGSLLICGGIALLVWGAIGLFFVVRWTVNKLCKKRKNISVQSDKEEIVRMVCFGAFLIFEIALNCCFAYQRMDKYNVWVGSIIMTILTMEMLIYLVNFRNQNGIARTSFYDAELKKDIFIFFRYDQECFMCGDAPRMNECNENYLIPYKRIQEVKLLPVSKNKKKDLLINYQRVMLQTTSGEYTLAKVLDKVKEELQDQNITQTKLDETSIYIKPSDKKAYYETPDKVKGSVEL